MKRKFSLTVLAIAVLTTGLLPGTNEPATDEGPVPDVKQVVVPAGYMVHIDPATGLLAEPTARTAPVVFDAGLQNALSTSPEGLVEVSSPVEGGGTMIDLQGRFQNTVISTIDENGELRAPCISKLPDNTPPGGKKEDKGGEQR
jgi:hypothetical protein